MNYRFGGKSELAFKKIQARYQHRTDFLYRNYILNSLFAEERLLRTILSRTSSM